MGLDMYLNKKIYLGWNYEHVTKEKNLPDLSEFGIDNRKVVEVTEEVLRWRKANAIHKWFVDTVQDGEDDCKEYYVSKKNLKELLEICKKVLENKELASELLPAESGFFFGSQEYDEWYFEDLKKTVETLEKIFKTESTDDYYYHSSW